MQSARYLTEFIVKNYGEPVTQPESSVNDQEVQDSTQKP